MVSVAFQTTGLQMLLSACSLLIYQSSLCCLSGDMTKHSLSSP